jgi:hypothetical protein
MTSGFITYLDIEKAYAVALSNDKKTEAIIHKATFRQVRTTISV